jgi:hypothetical protein
MRAALAGLLSSLVVLGLVAKKRNDAVSVQKSLQQLGASAAARNFMRPRIALLME